MLLVSEKKNVLVKLLMETDVCNNESCVNENKIINLSIIWKSRILSKKCLWKFKSNKIEKY